MGRMGDRKAQVWYTDFMVGVLIFSIVIMTYFYYVEHTQHSDDTLMSSLVSEAKTVSNSLATRGYPVGWTSANVTTVGLTDGNFRINSSKLSDFNSWSYEERRGYLHTTKDYYFYLELMNGTRFNELCADPGAGCAEWNTSYFLAQNTRLLIYEHEPVRMVLYVYQAP
ncbi:hypothetical protein KY359_05375 [Candidatus Woesearchaeota archaeon]|nr:hypothetical protein [Candidatus Woesearchaeota archaeon]